MVILICFLFFFFFVYAGTVFNFFFAKGPEKYKYSHPKFKKNQKKKNTTPTLLFIITLNNTNTHLDFEKKTQSINPTKMTSMAFFSPFSMKKEAPFFAVEVAHNVFFGNSRDAANFNALKRQKFTHVLNVAIEKSVDFSYEKDFTYLHLDVEDARLSKVFDQAFEFIDQAISNKGKVLIYCKYGLNRAATIAIAYLMHAEKMTLEKAFTHVLRLRPSITPLEENQKNLTDFETRLFGESSGLIEWKYSLTPRVSMESPRSSFEVEEVK